MPKYFPKPENPTEELFFGEEGDKIPAIENFLDPSQGGIKILLQHIILFRHYYAEEKDRMNKLEKELKKLQNAQESGDKKEECSTIQKEIDEIEEHMCNGLIEIMRPFGITSKDELFPRLDHQLWDQVDSNPNILRMEVVLLDAVIRKQQQRKFIQGVASEDATQKHIEKIGKALNQLYEKMNKLNGIVENAEYINNILPFRQLSELIQSNVENLSKIESDLQNDVALFRAAVSGHIRKQTIVSPATRYNEKKSDHQNDFLTSDKIQELLSSLNEKVINTREMIGTNNGQNMYDFLNTIEKKQESLKQQMDITNALLLKILQTSSRTSNEDIRAIVENNR